MGFNATAAWHRVEAIPPRRFIAAAAAAVLLIGFIDHFTGPILSLAIFYLVPVAASAWIAGEKRSNLLAVLAATTWAVADRIGPIAEPKAPIAYLNDLSLLLVFVFITRLVSALRSEVESQRALMQDVQRRLLPAEMPKLCGMDVAARWVPAWTVGGDYYDVIAAPGNRIAICLADVSGKGMPAALMMSNVQATVRALTADGMPPDAMLSALSALLFERLRRGAFVTLFYALFDATRSRLTFASAGHNPAILRRVDGSIVRLQSTGPVAGLLERAAYAAVTVEVGVGDRLIIYSDGITEYENAHGEQFGEQRLLGLLGNARSGSAEETCGAVVEALRAFGGGRPYGDDVTMLVVVRSPAHTAASRQPADTASDEAVACEVR